MNCRAILNKFTGNLTMYDFFGCYSKIYFAMEWVCKRNSFILSLNWVLTTWLSFILNNKAAKLTRISKCVIVNMNTVPEVFPLWLILAQLCKLAPIEVEIFNFYSFLIPWVLSSLELSWKLKLAFLITCCL